MCQCLYRSPPFHHEDQQVRDAKRRLRKLSNNEEPSTVAGTHCVLVIHFDLSQVLCIIDAGNIRVEPAYIEPDSYSFAGSTRFRNSMHRLSLNWMHRKGWECGEKRGHIFTAGNGPRSNAIAESRKQNKVGEMDTSVTYLETSRSYTALFDPCFLQTQVTCGHSRLLVL